MQLLSAFSFLCKRGQRSSVLIVIRRRIMVLRSKLCIMNQVRARCSGTVLLAKHAQMCQWIKRNLYTFILKAVIHFNFLLCLFKYQSWMSAFKLRTCDSMNVFFTMTWWLSCVFCFSLPRFYMHIYYICRNSSYVWGHSIDDLSVCDVFLCMREQTLGVFPHIFILPNADVDFLSCWRCFIQWRTKA